MFPTPPPDPSTYASPYPQSTPGAIILSIAYGIDVKSASDPFLRATVNASHAAAATLVPGKFLVDAIPIRKCLSAHRTPASN